MLHSKLLKLLYDKEYSEIEKVYQNNKNTIDKNEYNWILDPLDGTFNFVREISTCCLSLALFKKNKPPINTPYANAWPAEGSCGVKIKRERIKLIFKIAGAKAPAANFPCTLIIEVK